MAASEPMVDERLPTTRMFERLAGLDGLGDLRQRTLAFEQGGWARHNLRARLRRALFWAAKTAASSARPRINPGRINPLPPDRRCRRRPCAEPLLSATCLYHEISHATPHMMRIPQRLTKRMQCRTAAAFGQDEMAGEGQEHAEAEDLQRMLAAQDQRLQPVRFQPRPVLRQEAHGERRQREEMRKAQHVEIGLVDRIHPLLDPLRQPVVHLRHVPGQRDVERRTTR